MTKFADTPLYQYAQRVIALKGKENEVFKLVLDNNTIKDLIIFLNTDKQLGAEHVVSNGEALYNSLYQRTVYSPNDKKGGAGKPYELKDKGDYWRSFEVQVGRGVIVIESDPFKGNDNLFDSFGKQIEGLTESNLNTLIAEAYEYFVNWYSKNLISF